MEANTSVTTLCRMCDEHCAVDVRMENGKPTAITGCAVHPWNRGKTCAKAAAALAMVHHPDRIVKPLKRRKNRWEEISLDQALDEIAERLAAIRNESGARSVGVWKGEAIGFSQESDLYRRFIHAFGSPNYFSNDSVCYIGRNIGYRLGFGVCGVPDCENSRGIVLWGTNPPASHPALFGRIQHARRNGARLLVIDPRTTALARQAELHLPVRPGTDGCLALGLARLLIENGWYDREFIAGYSVGFEQFATLCRQFTPGFVEQETGISPARLEQAARLLHETAPHTAILAGNGPEHQIGGVQGIRAISLLDALLGSFDRPGGTRWPDDPGLADLTLYEALPLRQLGPIGAGEFPLIYELRRECSTLRLMDTLLSGRPYSLRGLLLTAANPLRTHPDSAKTARAMSQLDLFVVRDLFLTETAQLAHYVLPAASFLERSELHCHAAVQRLNLTRRLFRLPDALDEYEFLRELARRLDMADYFPWADEDELNRHLLAPTGLAAADLQNQPGGSEYRPIRYEKWRSQKLPTPSGKVEFASANLAGRGMPELPGYQPPEYKRTAVATRYPFLLLSGVRHPLNAYGRRHPLPADNADGEPRLEIRVADASAIGAGADDRVRVTSATGAIELAVRIVPDDALATGCVTTTHGWPETGVNELAGDAPLDPLDGFPALKSVSVVIEKILRREP